jgi:glutaredoxin 3
MCSFCVRAKDLLKKKGLKFEELFLGDNPDLMEEMIARSGGKRTVPQIFIGDTHLGGFDELYDKDKSGELDEIIG